jgi:predicted metal-dependent peptidase
MLILAPGEELKWFGFALNQFDIVQTTRIPTAALTIDPDRIVPRIHINPEFIAELEDGEIAAVLLHELWHYLNQSFSRQLLRDEDRWNFALDAVINWHIDEDVKRLHLNESKFHLPGEIVRIPPGSFDNQEDIYSENVYDQLGEQGKKPGQGGVGKSPLQSMYDKFKKGEITLVDDHSMFDDFDKVPEEILKNAIGETIAEATRAAGSEPGAATRILEKLFESVVPWTTLLRNFEGKHMKIGRKPSWKRPNRRFPGIQPGWTVKRGGKLAILIDVSGSTFNDMSRFWGEAYELSRRHETWVVQCDAEVCGKPQKLRRGKMPEVRGGGGTDMNPGLQECMRLNPDMVIVFTDGYLFNTPIKLSVPELWVICKDGREVPDKDCIKINT